MKALWTLIVVAFAIPFTGVIAILGGIGYLAHTYVYKPCTDGSSNDTKYFVVGLFDKFYNTVIKPFIDAGKEKEGGDE